jgi:cbb3-type cytochrome oxidase subunit 1
MAVLVGTIRHRLERVIYPTLWFGLALVVWLPILYLIGNLPGLTSAGQSLGSSMLSAGLEHMVIIGGGTGLAYFTVVKASGNPLASRQLARVGFWSLCFGAVWSGPAQIASGPFPAWLGGISAVLGLALPLATLSNATNLTLTVGPDLGQASDRPAISSALLGCLMAAFAGVVTALASFRSASALVSLTLFSEGLTVLVVFGVGGLLTASWTEHALPNLIGREPREAGHGRRRLRLTVIGMGGSGLCLMGAGLLGGYGWSGGAYTGAFENTGSGWAQSSGSPSLLTGLAVVFFLIGSLGLLSNGLTIVRTFTSGRPIAQEVLLIEETTR